MSALRNIARALAVLLGAAVTFVAAAVGLWLMTGGVAPRHATVVYTTPTRPPSADSAVAFNIPPGAVLVEPVPPGAAPPGVLIPSPMPASGMRPVEPGDVRLGAQPPAPSPSEGTPPGVIAPHPVPTPAMPPAPAAPGPARMPPGAMPPGALPPAEPAGGTFPWDVERPIGAEGEWAAAMAREDPPDIYPSARSAVRALAERAAVAAGELRQRRGGHLRVGVEGNAARYLIDEMVSALRAVCPDSTAAPGDPIVAGPAGTGNLCVRLTVNAPGTGPYDAGSAAVLLAWDDGSATLDARFQDRPWAAVPFEGLNRWPAREWIICHSPGPEATAEGAVGAARQEAVRRFYPRVLAVLEQSYGVPAGRRHRDTVLRQVESAVRSGRFVAEDFAQRFPRPYGDVWHAALLYDASDAVVHTIAAECAHTVVVRQGAHRSTALATAGVLAAVFVAYLFINAVTKGYFTGRLRVVAAVAVVAALVAAVVVGV